MDRLLKYINQYCEEAQIKGRRYRTNDGIMYDNRGEQQSEALAIYKDFGFIDRLVDKDLIDIDQLYEKTDFQDFLDIGYHKKSSILMTLAITYEPLKFLSELLK